MSIKTLHRRLDRATPDIRAEAERAEVLDRFFKEIAERDGPSKPLTKEEKEEFDRFFDNLQAQVDARKQGKPAPPHYQPSKVLTG
jgi:hypothetical protein